MKNIEPINLGNNETIHLKKGYFGYRVVYPHKDKDGKIIWINLLIGGWGNFFNLLIIMAILLLIMFSYKHDMNNCINVAWDMWEAEFNSLTVPTFVSNTNNFNLTWEGETNVEAQTSTGS